MRHIIGWPSIRRLKRTKHAGPKISIQMNGRQKYKNGEPESGKDNNWKHKSIENNTKRASKKRLDLTINQEFLYNTAATLL